MTKIKDNKNFSLSEGSFLNYLEEAYVLLIESYNDLKRENFDCSNKDEPKIQNELVKRAEKKRKKIYF